MGQGPRGLHEVRGRRQDRATDAPVHGDLRGADGVDDDTGRVRGVPDLELVLEVQRDVAEGAALEADVRPLAVVEPRDVVGRADVDVLGAQVAVPDLGGDGVGLRDLLGLEAVTLEHVLEVHVAADVQLHGALQQDTAVLEELRHHAVRDGRADLRLDVVTDDRHAGLGELVRPLLGAGDEHREGVHEADLGVERALGVEAGGVLGTHRQVADQDVDLAVLQDLHDVDRGLVGLLDGLEVVLAETVEGVTTLHGDAGRRHVADLDGVVLAGADGVREVEADLLGVDVERGDELHVTDVVLAELHVHQPRDLAGGVGVLVVLDTLNQRRGTVADAHDGYANRTHSGCSL